MVSIAAYVFVTALFLITLVFLKNSKASAAAREAGLRLPPGPWQLPVIGSLHHLLGALPVHRAMRDLSRRHGPLMLLKLGGVRAVIATSPEAAQEFMKTHDAAFANRPLTATTRIVSDGGRDIVFSPSNEYWRELRKICFLELLSPKRIQSFRHIREAEVANLIADVSSAPPAKTVNLGKMMSMLTIDIAVRAVIGDRCKDRDVLLQEIDKLVGLLAGFSLAELFPSSRLAGIISAVPRRTARCIGAFHAILEHIIDEHEERYRAGGQESDLVDVLLRIQRKGELQFPLSRESIRAVIFDMFVAGSETVSTALEWAMAELVRNPRVMQRAQAEVRQVFRGQGKVTEDALSQLNYLHLVIKETLRLHSPLPLLMPRHSESTHRVLGYDVPKHTTVIINVWAMARDPKNWDDPEEFKPERFEGSSVDVKGLNFELIPFGAGRRICPGLQFALANLQLAIVSLLFHFDWNLPDGMKPEDMDMSEGIGLTVWRKSELLLHPVVRVPFSAA